MQKDDAIINPVKGKSAPDLAPVTVMTSSQSDLDLLCDLSGLCDSHFKNLMMSRIYPGYDNYIDFSVAGPVVGAPYAVMLLESLIVWGAQKIIFWGWCGAISPQVKIGDIIVPTGAIIDEGTSKHYHADENEIAKPSDRVAEKTKAVLRESNLAFHEGVVWSTDAIYRETCEKVEHFQAKDVLAVEMEMSALFTVGKFRNVEVGGILVVSDELSALQWNIGFKDKRFKQSRMAVAEGIDHLCQKLLTPS
ncbi:nucleoside phosphorylase [Desulfobacterales bacterium HSG2]|nr:nucleoside phosphorylase [Desulfobacterales bacterium HSG2]